MGAGVVVDVVRRSIARRNGALAKWSPVDLVSERLTGSLRHDVVPR